MISSSSDLQAITVAALLDDVGRTSRSVPVRRSFVQHGAQSSPVPGPLSAIIRHHDATALDLFLLHRAAASAEPWDVTRPAQMWGRCLAHGTDKDSGSSVVSKTWARLDQVYNLVSRSRSGRLAEVTSLTEDGSRNAYTSPLKAYFKLPYDYWLSSEAYYRTLSLPAKAMLLIASTLAPGFTLPEERVPRWYGLSPDTAGRGLRELRERDILWRDSRTVVDMLSASGFRTDYTYSLLPPFHQRSRPTLHLTAVPAMATGT